MKYHWNLEQRSPEWYAIRRLRLTGSNATAIATAGAGLKTLVTDLVLDQIIQAEEDYDNKHLKRGRDLEPVAKTLYEFKNGVTIKECGFMTMGEYAGASPDGLVGDDGGVEIKCRLPKYHIKYLMGEKIDSGIMWQIQMNLLVSGRKWWDFLSYCPDFKQSLYVERVLPDEKAFEKLNNGILKGAKMIKELTENEMIKREME